MAELVYRMSDQRIFEQIVPLLEELIRDYDTDFSGGITLESRLVTDLAFDSLSIVMLIVAIEGHFRQQGLPFEKLLLTDGEYVKDFTVDELVRFLEAHLV